MRFWLRALILLQLALGVTLGAWAADPPNPAARRVHPAKPAFPVLQLPDAVSQGQRAIDLLGRQLPAVAAWYGKTPAAFEAMLRNDRRMRVDVRGRVFVVDEIDAPLQAAAPTNLLDGSLLPLDQTFLLHSRAGAKRTIYLNFKGASLVNTAWAPTSTLTALPFDTDGLPGTFSTAELQRIQYIWQRVAEDYAPFDVDVTTEAPAADVLTRSTSTDQIFGTTVVITSRTGVYSCSCGGVAYLGIFDDTSDFYKPALVFYDALGSGDEKYVAEAISHEAGHNMGLNHDGTATVGYYQGHGSGATGWAPIMGVGYYQSLVQWSKGEYAGANNTQDDYVVMESNGLPIRLDDHSDTITSATALQPGTLNGSTVLMADGVIERPADVDVFVLSASVGTLTVSVSPASRSANLDVGVELRNAAGTVVASANPTDALPASLSFNVPAAGTYYIAVQGVGKGDLTTGYSDYGSLGVYRVVVSAGGVVAQPPVAVASATPASGSAPLNVAFSGAGSYDPDGSIASYQWNFGDGSATASGATVSHTYAAGTYTAQLLVTDNAGLTSTKTLTINAAAGQAPVAVVVATPTSGTVPLTVNFSGTGSSDSDGTVTGYAWAFGDNTSGTGSVISHTYNTAGSYNAVLTVTDNTGLKGTRSVTITATAVPVPMHLSALSLAVVNSNRGWRASGTVTVQDGSGRGVPGAVVTGTWSGGLVSGTVTATTGSTGAAAINSATTKKTGTITFTVTGITLNGYRYDSTANTASTTTSVSR